MTAVLCFGLIGIHGSCGLIKNSSIFLRGLTCSVGSGLPVPGPGVASVPHVASVPGPPHACCPNLGFPVLSFPWFF